MLPGYTSTLAAIVLIGGVQIAVTGVARLYVGRILAEVQGPPRRSGGEEQPADGGDGTDTEPGGQPARETRYPDDHSRRERASDGQADRRVVRRIEHLLGENL